MIAVKRLQSLLWVIVITVGAVSAYLVSLRVATERSKLQKVEQQIQLTKAEIRYLETEFGARASVRQLEMWNADDFRYPAPTVGQYVANERSLANLVGVEANGGTYVAPPVMTADASAAGPAAPTVSTAAVKSPAVTQIRAELAIVRPANAAETKPAPAAAKPRIVQVAAVAPVSPPATRRTATPDAAARRAERMAMLDDALLDDNTLADLRKRASSERTGKN